MEKNPAAVEMANIIYRVSYMSGDAPSYMPGDAPSYMSGDAPNKIKRRGSFPFLTKNNGKGNC